MLAFPPAREIRFAPAGTPVDVRSLSAALAQLRRRLAASCVPSYVTDELLSNLDEVASAVPRYGRTIVDPAAICQDLWGHWLAFQRVLIDANGDDESPGVFRFCLHLLAKADESLKLAEEALGAGRFAQACAQIGALAAALSDRGARDRLPVIRRAIGRLSKSLAVTPLFVALRCERYVYACQCVKCVRASIGGLVNLQRAHIQIQSDADETQRRLAALVPRCVAPASVHSGCARRR
jgi:hypothetical protein